jgi:hypothetical protein
MCTSVAAMPSTFSGDGEVIAGRHGRCPSHAGPTVGKGLAVGEGVVGEDSSVIVGDGEGVGDDGAVADGVATAV